MKTRFYCFLILVLLTAPVSAADHPGTAYAPPTWKKIKDGRWPGPEQNWYRLSPKEFVLQVSADGKKWEPVKDKKWQDRSGEWLMLKARRLMWSVDGQKGWAEVPEWKWVAADGKWYRFDKEWTLWQLVE